MQNEITKETKEEKNFEITIKALASDYKLISSEQVRIQAIITICDYMAIFWHLPTDDNIKRLWVIEFYKEIVKNTITNKELELAWENIKNNTESKFLKGILPPEDFKKEALVVRKNNNIIAWEEFNKKEAKIKIEERKEEEEKLKKQKEEHKYKMKNDVEYRKKEEERIKILDNIFNSNKK